MLKSFGFFFFFIFLNIQIRFLSINTHFIINLQFAFLTGKEIFLFRGGLHILKKTIRTDFYFSDFYCLQPYPPPSQYLLQIIFHIIPQNLPLSHHSTQISICNLMSDNTFANFSNRLISISSMHLLIKFERFLPMNSPYSKPLNLKPLHFFTNLHSTELNFLNSRREFNSSLIEPSEANESYSVFNLFSVLYNYQPFVGFGFFPSVGVEFESGPQNEACSEQPIHIGRGVDRGDKVDKIFFEKEQRTSYSSHSYQKK